MWGVWLEFELTSSRHSRFWRSIENIASCLALYLKIDLHVRRHPSISFFIGRCTNLEGKIRRHSQVSDAPPHCSNTWLKSFARVCWYCILSCILYIPHCVSVCGRGTAVMRRVRATSDGACRMCTVFTHAPSWLTFPAQTVKDVRQSSSATELTNLLYLHEHNSLM